LLSNIFGLLVRQAPCPTYGRQSDNAGRLWHDAQGHLASVCPSHHCLSVAADKATACWLQLFLAGSLLVSVGRVSALLRCCCCCCCYGPSAW